MNKKEFLRTILYIFLFESIFVFLKYILNNYF